MNFTEWKQYFLTNRSHFDHIDFDESDQFTEEEKSVISRSLQQFQKGEHSEGKTLYSFAKKFPDPEYLECIRLFIPEEQRHAKVLGTFMKRHGIPFINGHWVDGVFRWLRKLGGIENSVRVLLIAEIIAKVYYKALQNASSSVVLNKICVQILKDEDQHIRFQCDALRVFYRRKHFLSRFFIRSWQSVLMTGTIFIVWWHHKKVLHRGGYYFGKFFLECLLVFFETEHSIRSSAEFSSNKQVMSAKMPLSA